ncbi:MAG: hypothetical protein ACXVWU_13245 [Nocardioides sp.]
MSGLAKVLRYVAFGAMALFGLLGTMFVAGYAFDDPGGWAALGMTALWVVPMLALCAFAWRRPERAGPVLVGVSAAVLAFGLVDALFAVVPRDAWGPVTGISVFALGVALAFLGLRRALLAGTVMVVVALTQAATVVLGHAAREGGDGPGLGAMLGGSSGVVVMPILLVGLLFLVAGALDHEGLHTPTAHPAH